MHHISILVPQGNFSIVNIEGSYQMFKWVNADRESRESPALFDVHLVGAQKTSRDTSGLFSIHPDLLLDEVRKTDLIILPALHGNVEENLRLNEKLIPWLKRQHKQGAAIASFCVGSFFLAAIGLLDGKPCSTHWQFAAEFRKKFPEVDLKDEQILTEAKGIYSSGGAYAFTNLLVYLIEKYAGREIAISVAKAFMIDIDRQSQSPFSIFNGQKSHQDEIVLQVQEYLETYYKERISVDTICDRFHLGRRTFERRFKKATSNTLVEYLQRVRIEVAKKQLELKKKNVSEVMYEVGYSDKKAFREVFKRFTGLSPYEYLKKYQA